MSASKKDRTTAPRLGSRPSRAKHVDDRNVAPPAGYRPAGKSKPGERAMRAQLDSPTRDSAEGTAATDDPDQAPADRQLHEQLSGEGRGAASEGSSTSSRPTPQPGQASAPEPALVVSDDPPAPPRDPWWTDERERAFQMVLQGIPQHQVAAELGRDRHTVARWAEDERFETRLYDENVARFKASRQRRSMQTLRLTDKAERLAGKMLDKAIDLAERGKDDLGTRLAARDWLQEFRENSRREDEIYGLDKQRVDVNVSGEVQHKHRGKVDVSFKAFLSTSLRNMGVDPDAEEVDAGRADEALVAITERALMEGSFLDDLVEREEKVKLAPVLSGR